MSKVIISLSGGMDSATLLATAVAAKHEITCVGFRYGSKHNQWELEAAAALAGHYQVPYRVLDMGQVFAGFRSNLLKGQGAVPEGHYEARSMELTVVPARNIIFASVLAGVAWSEGAEAVWLGAHAGDHCIPAGTPVIARRGLVPIEALEPGRDEVMSFDKEEHKTCWKKLIQLTEKGRPSSVLRLVTKSGAVLECTSEHKVYVVQLTGWTKNGYTKEVTIKRAADLESGDLLITPSGCLDAEGDFPKDVDLTKQEGFEGGFDESGVWFKAGNRGARFVPLEHYLALTAWYVTEGSPTGGGARPNTAGVYIAQSETANPDKLEQILQHVRAWGHEPSIHGSGRNTVVYFSGPAGKVLRQCGIHSRDKRLPAWFFGLPNKDLQTLFHTMIAGDGHVQDGDKGYYQFVSTSKHLLGQMAYIGSRLGYKMSMRKLICSEDTYVLGFSAGRFKPNLNRIGDGAHSPIVSVEKKANLVPVFDIGVEGANNFFVGHGVPILVSNSIYPDCRPEFMEAMDRAVQTGSSGKVRLVTPFLLVDKAEILRRGLLLQTPYHLTRTCYQDQQVACGRCGSCTERLEAFAANGIDDPLPYTSRVILPREL